MSSTALTAERADVARPRFTRANDIPAFGLAFGYTLLYLGLIVLLPLAALVVRASSLGLSGFWAALTDERVVAALKVSFGLSFAAALVDAAFGLLAAWVLTRYRFPGRKLLDAAVDLPFALPTAVAGIAVAALYAPNGWIGSLVAPLGLKVAFTPLGIFVALVFVGLPFVRDAPGDQPHPGLGPAELRSWLSKLHLRPGLLTAGGRSRAKRLSRASFSRVSCLPFWGCFWSCPSRRSSLRPCARAARPTS